MKKAIPSWVFGGVIGLLMAINLILFVVVGWLYRENGRLRRQFSARAQAAPASPSPEDVRRVIEAARLGQLERLKSILDQRPELLHARVSKGDSTLLHHAAF